MKQLFLCLILLCSISAYGQDRDLILTTTGDSIRCRIIDVTSNEIQFRFGVGSIISITRNEVEMYEYNYYVSSTSSVKQKKEKSTRTPSLNDYPPFYIGIAAGVTPYGSISIGDTEGFAMALGVEVAYFFSKWLGVGLKFNTLSCNVDFDKLTYSDMVTFFGPALYGRYDLEKLSFTAGVGGGMLNWSITKQEKSGVSLNEETTSSAGGFVSVGGNYMLTQKIGIGLNVQSIFGSITNSDDVKRNPTGIGGTIGINLRF